MDGAFVPISSNYASRLEHCKPGETVHFGFLDGILDIEIGANGGSCQFCLAYGAFLFLFQGEKQTIAAKDVTIFALHRIDEHLET